MPDYDAIAAEFGGTVKASEVDALAAQYGGVVTSAPKRKVNTKSLEGMVALAESTDPDLGRQAREIRDAKPTMSTWQRLGAGLGAFNPAEALLRTSPDLTNLSPLKVPELTANYAKTIAGGLASAFTGNAEYDQSAPGQSRRTFRDVVDIALPAPSAEQTAATEAQVKGVLGDTLGGVANKMSSVNQSVGRGAVGLAADIALDPTTYTGLPLLKGAKAVAGAAGKVAGAAGRGVLAAADAVSPTLATGLKGTADAVGAAGAAGMQTAKDLMGQLFVFAYNTSPGMGNRVLELQGRLSKVLGGLSDSNKRRLYDELSPEQQDQMRVLMLEGKRAELGARQSIESAKEDAAKLLAGKVERQPVLPGTQKVKPKSPTAQTLPGEPVKQDIAGLVPDQDKAGTAIPLPVRNATADTGIDKAEQLGLGLDPPVKPELRQASLGLPELPMKDITARDRSLVRSAAIDARERTPEWYAERAAQSSKERMAATVARKQAEGKAVAIAATRIPPKAKSFKAAEDIMKAAREDTKNSVARRALEEDAAGVWGKFARQFDQRASMGDYSLDEVAKGYEATRNLLRKQYGDTVRIYRADAPVTEHSKDTITALFGDETLAQKFAKNGRKVEPYDVKVDDIVAVHARDSGYYELVVRKPPQGFTPAHASGDPKLQSVIDAQMARSEKMGKGTAGLDETYQSYFPSLSSERVAKFHEATAGMRVGAENYKKHYQGLLKDDDLVKSPAEAFTRVEYAMVKDRLTRDALTEMVRDTGKPLTQMVDGKSVPTFASDAAAEAAGFTKVTTKGADGKALGYVPTKDKAFLDDMINPTRSEWPDKIARATGFDAMQALFKRSVTGIFPAFHVRNFISGHIQNFERLGKDALRPANLVDGQRLALAMARQPSGAHTITVGGGKVASLKSVLAPFERRFGTSSSYISDIADATADKPTWFTPMTKAAGQAASQAGAKMPAFVQKAAKVVGNPISQEGLPFRTARAVGNFIETQQKAAAYLTSLRQGKTVEQALTDAAAAGFDYRALTQFESKVMRRLVPFYSFTRKNAELQMRTLGENPERINQVMKVIDNLGESAEPGERDTLPDYIRGSAAVKMADTPDGVKQYISGFGTPVEAVAELTNTARGGPGFMLQKFSQLSPPLKLALELSFGKDSFRQRPLEEVTDAREYRAAPEWFKKAVGITEVAFPVRQRLPNGKFIVTGTRTRQVIEDPWKLHVLRSLPSARLVSTLDALSGGDDLKGTAVALKLLSGLKVQQLDLEAHQEADQRKRSRQVEDMMAKYNEGYVMRQFVKKKQKKGGA